MTEDEMVKAHELLRSDIHLTVQNRLGEMNLTPEDRERWRDWLNFNFNNLDGAEQAIKDELVRD